MIYQIKRAFVPSSPAECLKLSIVLAVAMAIIGQRLSWLYAQEWPLDYDGFYYLVELKHRLATGQGYYHDSSPFFFVLTLFAKGLGGNLPNVLNNWIVLSLVLFSAGLFLLGNEYSNKPWSALVIAVLPWGVDVSWYFAYGFLKQLGAVSFIVFGMGLYHLSGCTKNLKLAAIAITIIGALFHPFGVVLLSLLAVPLIFQKIKNSTFKFGLVSILCVIVVFTISTRWHITEHLALTGEWVWNKLHKVRAISKVELFEAAILFGLGAVLCVMSIKHRSNKALFVLSVTWLLLVLPIWAIAFGSPAYRFGRTSIWLLFIMLAISQSMFATSHYGKLYFRHLTLVVGGLLLAGSLVLDQQRQPIGPRTRLVLDQVVSQKLQDWLPKEAVIIAPHGLQYALTYFAGVSSQRLTPKQNTSVYKLKRNIFKANAQCGSSICFNLNQQWKIEKIR